MLKEKKIKHTIKVIGMLRMYILNLQKENRLCHHYKLNTKIPLIGLYYVSTGSGAFSFFFIVEYHKKDNLVSMLSLSSFC